MLNFSFAVAGRVFFAAYFAIFLSFLPLSNIHINIKSLLFNTICTTNQYAKISKKIEIEKLFSIPIHKVVLKTHSGGEVTPEIESILTSEEVDRADLRPPSVHIAST